MESSTSSRALIPLNTPVRYIKFGNSGLWEQECIEKGVARLSFSSGRTDRFRLCTKRKWGDLTTSFISEGKSKATATRFANEVKLFFEDKGSMLWITFFGERLWWGQFTNEPAQQYGDNNSVLRIISGGWQSTDLRKEPLTKERLSGALTKLAAYRGTSCSVEEAEYTIRRINGEKSPIVEKAIAASSAIKASILEMMQMLHWKDFELLVDLVFSTSGWRRQGATGGPQKTLDLDLILPTTGERAFVQVKSETNCSELETYITRLDDLHHKHMFYVYHSYSGKPPIKDERVTLIDGAKLAEMVLDAGLVNWLIRKIS